MVRFILNAVIYLGSAALGLFVASLVLGSDFTLPPAALLLATVFFAVFQLILSPFIFKMTHKYASALTGGVGLVSTWVALLLTSMFVGDFDISGGISTWLAAIVIVWLVTAIATWVLPMFLLKEAVENRKDK
ncbi:phage holin family protein [Demequina zhanjiangensis]|uniref:Phage holin family protein n=1 Tax=Demequina zhanjiangensis TaxID=3051659 RepID=A0ABT8G2U9_9MICO|nr:phage holin family protein [Demequina sp. SYSU T00b26]MDN4473418.1 phage holin family protein [Demequina sp. SYSU T00b26]